MTVDESETQSDGLVEFGGLGDRIGCTWLLGAATTMVLDYLPSLLEGFGVLGGIIGLILVIGITLGSLKLAFTLWDDAFEGDSR